MEKLRIIGLDDDNHAPCFRCEDGTMFQNYQELVAFLCQPHDMAIEVKMFAIIDEPDCIGGLNDYEPEQVDDMFYFMEDVAPCPEGMIPDLIFELFWMGVNRKHW